MENKTEYFVLQPDGLKWIENMPEEPKYALPCSGVSRPYLDRRNAAIRVRYNEALQSAIASAIEVINHEDVRQALLKALNWNPHPDEHRFDVGVPYPLLCSVEKGDKPLNKCEPCNKIGLSHCSHPEECGQIAIGPVALVTFSEPAAGIEPEKEIQEDQDDLWDAFGNEVNKWKHPEDGIGFHCLTNHLKKNWILTRKNK